jgi:hypothetical protein
VGEGFSDRGFDVATPRGRRMDHTIEELRKDPSLVAGLGIEELVDHHAKVIGDLAEPPIIIGHSVGGLVTQLLLDRGYGAAGIALHPGQTKGVYSLPPKQLAAAWPAIKNPAKPQARCIARGDAVPLRVRQRPPRFCFGRGVARVPRTRAGASSVPSCARQLQPERRHQGRLPKARSCPAADDLRQPRPNHPTW